MEVRQNAWFITENPVEMDDLQTGGTPIISGNLHRITLW